MNKTACGFALPTANCPLKMNSLTDDPTLRLRQSIYWLLICISVGIMLGRVLAVDAVDRTGLEKDRLNRISGELERKRIELDQQGLKGEALKDELSAIEIRLRRAAQRRSPL